MRQLPNISRNFLTESKLDLKKHLTSSCKSVFSSFGLRGRANKISLKLEKATLQLTYMDGGHEIHNGKSLLKFNYRHAIYFDSLNPFFRTQDDIQQFQSVKSDIEGVLIEKLGGKSINGDMWVRCFSIEEIENVITPAVNSSCEAIFKRCDPDEYYIFGQQWWRNGNRSAINFVLRMICLARLRNDKEFFEEILHDIEISGSSQTLRAVNEILRKVGKPELR